MMLQVSQSIKDIYFLNMDIMSCNNNNNNMFLKSIQNNIIMFNSDFYLKPNPSHLSFHKILIDYLVLLESEGSNIII